MLTDRLLYWEREFFFIELLIDLLSSYLLISTSVSIFTDNMMEISGMRFTRTFRFLSSIIQMVMEYTIQVIRSLSV